MLSLLHSYSQVRERRIQRVSKNVTLEEAPVFNPTEEVSFAFATMKRQTMDCFTSSLVNNDVLLTEKNMLNGLSGVQ